jgi:capsular polysaccharide biosynthesis protein
VLTAVLVACLLAGAAVVVLSHKTYQAQATLNVDARWEGATDPDAALRASDTLSQIFIAQATSTGLLQKVIDANGLSLTPQALAKRINAGSVHGTSLVGVKATSGSPEDAAAIANAVAQALIDQNTREVKARFDPTIAYLNSELSSLQSQITAVQAEKPGNAQAAADHTARLTLLQNEYAATYSELQNAQIGEQRGIATLSLAERATPPGGPSSPDPLRYMLAALVAGLALGVLAALLVERFDDRLFNAQRLAEATGSPLVVQVPAATGERTRAYDLIRSALRARYPDSNLVMLAAASPRDHAETPAGELGAAAAHSGERVLVVRADADRSGVPHPAANGSASANGSSLTTIALPSSPDAATGLKALAGGGGQYDLAVLAVASPDRNPAFFSLAGPARVAMLVATAGQTRLQDARRTAELLRQAGVDLAGSIVLEKPGRSTSEGTARTR